MTGRALTFAELWRRTAALASPVLLQSAIWLTILTGLGIAADLTWRQEQLSNLLSLIAACAVTVAQFAVTCAVLRSAVPSGRPLASFGRFFLLTIVSGLALILGFLLLVLPGIFLAIRWSASVPALLERNLDVGESLRLSWRQTRGHEWTILLLIISIWLPAILLGGTTVALNPYGPSVAGSLLLNLSINLALLAAWHAGVAIHFATDDKKEVGEVFA